VLHFALHRRAISGTMFLMCLGIPGEIIELREEKGLRFARVRFGGITRSVCLEYVPEAVVGDFVVVHVGFAISTIDAEEARRTYELLESLGETEDLRASLDDPGEAS
jgi:hydrogenase expression/formation protein HypC